MEGFLSFVGTITFGVSKHAAARAQQRGLGAATMNSISLHADRETWVGRGCRLVHVTRGRLKELVERDVLTPTSAERLAGAALIFGEDEGVVTAMHLTRRWHGPKGLRRHRPRPRRS